MLDGVIAGTFRYDRGGITETTPWRKLSRRALRAEADRFLSVR